MPSLMNQPGLGSAAQLNARMCAVFHFCMLASAYGPECSSEITFTHITGSPLVAAIISVILAGRPTLDPTATSAVSLVPRASTQQPENPSLIRCLAASYPFVVPGRTSTTERAPVI